MPAEIRSRDVTQTSKGNFASHQKRRNLLHKIPKKEYFCADRLIPAGIMKSLKTVDWYKTSPYLFFYKYSYGEVLVASNVPEQH
jgi:hypothetical protein